MIKLTPPKTHKIVCTSPKEPRIDPRELMEVLGAEEVTGEELFRLKQRLAGIVRVGSSVGEQRIFTPSGAGSTPARPTDEDA